jgi:hypothetical protein
MSKIKGEERDCCFVGDQGLKGCEMELDCLMDFECTLLDVDDPLELTWSWIPLLLDEGSEPVSSDNESLSTLSTALDDWAGDDSASDSTYEAAGDDSCLSEITDSLLLETEDDSVSEITTCSGSNDEPPTYHISTFLELVHCRTQASRSKAYYTQVYRRERAKNWRIKREKILQRLRNGGGRSNAAKNPVRQKATGQRIRVNGKFVKASSQHILYSDL